jgi:hypothetical protein
MCIEQRATRRGNLTHHALPVIARSTATWQSQSVIARLGYKPWQSIRSHFLSAGTSEFVVALVYYILLSAGSKKCTREVVVALVCYTPLFAGTVAYIVCGFKKVNPQTLYEVAWIQAIF